MGQRGRIFVKLDAGRRGDRVAREVVGRGAEAAGADDDLRPIDRRAEHGDVVFQVVADGRVEGDRDADLAQPLAEPLAIGVQPLAAGQLVANGNDFGTHESGGWGSGRLGARDGEL